MMKGRDVCGDLLTLVVISSETLVTRPGELVDPIMIGAAMARAAQRAYESVRQPAEGTMLTVMRWAISRITVSIVPSAGWRTDS